MVRPVVYLLVGLAAIAAGASAVAMIGSDDQPPKPTGSSDVACDIVWEPGDSIDQLVASLAPGRTACLREGVHSSDENIAIASPGVTLTGYPGEQATVEGRVWIERGANGVTVENLHLDGRNPEDLPSPTVNAHDTAWSGNTITNGHDGVSCFNLGHPEYGHADRTVIEDNQIYDCGGRNANHDHGIYVAFASDTLIRDNWIYSNADRGIQLYPAAEGTLITGNVIDGNGQGLNFSCNQDSCSRRNLVEGNVIAYSTISWNVYGHSQGADPDGSNILRGNCLWPAENGYADEGGIDSDPDFFSEAQNVVGEPLYEDRANQDFRLAEGSPCLALEDLE